MFKQRARTSVGAAAPKAIPATPPPIYNPDSNEKPNWQKAFPIQGQGTACFNIVRNSAFALVVRDSDSSDWISLDVHENVAFFTMSLGGAQQTLASTRVAKAGYETDVKVTYWLSYDRDTLRIKYGKGYRMTDTTLMSYDFLEGYEDEESQHHRREELSSLFNPVATRCVAQFDEANPAKLRSKYKDYIEKLQATGEAKRKRADMESVLDIEGMVEFDKYPVTCNRPPTIWDSSNINLFYLDQSDYTFSASLPAAAMELYENVRTCELDYPAEVEPVLLSDAIRYSVETEGCHLNNILKAKAGEFGEAGEGEDLTTYLRITLGHSMGKSPGIPYVLEIWPKRHMSPIHNHGNANAVIKVLHGSINIAVYNKYSLTIDDEELDPELLFKFDAGKGDITWMDRNWYQVHKLENISNDYCATIQCYNYAPGDTKHWPYFDYIGDAATIGEFFPNSDDTFENMRTTVLNEYKNHLKS